MLDGTEHFECDCGSDEHTLRFTLNLDPDDTVIYTSVFLHQWRPWWKRWWIALRYACGYKCKYGHWDCFQLRREDADRLKALLDKLSNALGNSAGACARPVSEANES